MENRAMTVCKPAATFKLRCNNCTCLPSANKAFCTAKLCRTIFDTSFPSSLASDSEEIDNEIPEETLRKTELRKVTVEELDSDDFRCEPNLPFLLDCNTCWCSEDGLEPRLCTRIACNPKVYSLADQQ